MYRLFVFVISLAISLLVSCAAKDSLPHPDAGPVTVGFRVGGETTRTQINDDGRSTSWTTDDRIALWARNDAGEFSLSAQPFDIYYRGVNTSDAYFTAKLSQAMAEGRYTYYAAYPLPESLDGTKATFTIPAVQDGLVGGGADIMVATPAEASQLGPLENDPDLSLTMQHMLHVLRFYIPEGRNTLGEPVERIVLTMPQQISGRATADITDPGGGITLTEGGNTIKLNLTEPLDASTAADYAYACAAIFPSTQYGADDVMQVSLYSKNYAATVDDILLAGRTFAAGHVTPVPMKPTQKELRPKLRFRIATNNLGEDIQKITISAPDDTTWDLSVIVPDDYTYTSGEKDITISAPKGGTITSDDYFEFSFYNTADIEALEGKTITVSYESQSAIVTDTVTIPTDASKNNPAAIDLNVPYLYYEDFASLSSSLEVKTEYTGGGDSGNPDAIELNGYGLQGWSGARIGGKAGVGIRICCRYESGLFIKAIYCGRVDSAPMAAIKNGKSVKVRVLFDYSSAQSHNNGQTTYWAGTTTNTDKLAGNTDIENVIIKETAINRDFDVNETDQSYETRHTNSYDTTCTSATRLSWKVGTNRGGEFGSNGNYWLYIDNIRVQIVK